MIRNHTTAAVPCLIFSDVNFNFFLCFVHNNRFCFLQVWCPTVFTSGHHVLLNFSLQDTVLLSSQKMFNTAPVGTEFQSPVANGKYECRYVSVLECGTWNWYLCPQELQCLGSGNPLCGLCQQHCS